MAAAVSHAQSSGQWRFSMDDARRVTGMTWASNPSSVMMPVVAYDQVTSGDRVQFRRLNGPIGNLPQQLVGRRNLLTVAPSGAVIEFPSRVRIPGRSFEMPVTIVDPVSKSTLSKIAGKALKFVPLVGGALELAELLDEIDVTRQGDQFYDSSSSSVSFYTSSGYRAVSFYSGIGEIFYYDHRPYCQDSVKYSFRRNARLLSCTVNQLPHKQIWVVSYSSDDGIITEQSDAFPASNCPAGYWVSNGVCSPPAAPQPLSEERLIELMDLRASIDRLVNAINALPFDDPRVIDVMAREVNSEPEDHRVRLFGQTSTGPHSVQVGEPVTTTTTNPDGSTVTRTTTTTATASGDSIVIKTETVTKTYDPSGQPTGTTTTTTTPTDSSNPNSPQQEDLECGLPGTPPCKIDETGTPAPPEDDGEFVFKQAIPACLKADWKSCFPELPDINWSFRLPSGCAPIPVPFERFGFSAVNICPWQPMIHDIMSMVWAAAGLFGAIGILSGRRNSDA